MLVLLGEEYVSEAEAAGEVKADPVEEGTVAEGSGVVEEHPAKMDP